MTGAIASTRPPHPCRTTTGSPEPRSTRRVVCPRAATVVADSSNAMRAMVAYGALTLLDLDPLEHDVLDGTIPRRRLDRRDLLDDVHALGHLAEDRVLVVQPRRRLHRDEELRPVRVRPRVRHRQQARLVELRPPGGALVLEAVAGTA